MANSAPKLPKSITILGTPTTIKLSAKLPEEANSDRDTLGMADLLDHVIHVHKDLSPEAKKRILLHEVVHHALWRSGLSQSINGDLEEVMAQTFAYLYQELKRQGI